MEQDGDCRITVADGPETALRTMAVGQLLACNEGRAGQPADPRALTLLLRDAAGEAVGGLWGSTRWRWLTVETLYIPAPLRRRGFGRRLMRQAEAEAMRRGCIGACTETYSFQARGFYEGLGYAVVGTLTDCPPGHGRHLLARRFAAGA